jgi:hypothetical protein
MLCALSTGFTGCGVHGIFVDALNERAKRFYLKQGFIPLTVKTAILCSSYKIYRTAV